MRGRKEKWCEKKRDKIQTESIKERERYVFEGNWE
jgi:hypothetical protein